LPPEVYRQYARAVTHVPDVGAGYGLTLFAERLDWLPLLPENKAEGSAYRAGATVHGDLIFHLGGAVSHTKRRPRPLPGLYWIWPLIHTGFFLKLPRSVRKLLGPLAWRPMTPATLQEAKQLLFEDPEDYIHMLRAGAPLAAERSTRDTR